MPKRKPVYTREFKLAILGQVSSGVPVVQVARENGLHPALVFRWKNEYLDNPEKAFSGPGNPYKDQARIAELERMVGRLYSENEFTRNRP
jgi:transposase